MTDSAEVASQQTSKGRGRWRILPAARLAWPERPSYLSSSMKRVGIINVTGYAGAELARLLWRHPEVRLSWVTLPRKLPFLSF